MHLEKQRVTPSGVGTLMYVGDDEPSKTLRIDAIKVGIGGIAVYAASKSSLGPISKTLIVIAGAITIKRGITR